MLFEGYLLGLWIRLSLILDVKLCDIIPFYSGSKQTWHIMESSDIKKEIRYDVSINSE